MLLTKNNFLCPTNAIQVTIFPLYLLLILIYLQSILQQIYKAQMKNKRQSRSNAHKFSSLSKITQETNFFKDSIVIHEKRKALNPNNPQLYDRMKKFLKSNRKHQRHRSQSHSIIVRSQEQKKLMNFLGPNYLPKLSSPLQISKSQNKQSDDIFQNQNNPKSRTKKIVFSSIDQILVNQDKFMKTYFKDLQRAKVEFRGQKVDYVFPEITVNIWKVSGYLSGDFILLKGVNKRGKQVIKKYVYERVYSRVRQEYQAWVQDKFYFQL